MPWKKIRKEESHAWNKKLKYTKAPFTQYPYYTSSEQSLRLSRVIFIIYEIKGEETAFACIAEIGIFPCKIGVIEGAPVLLHDRVDIPLVIEELKKFARSRRYMHLQVRPIDTSLEIWFRNDPAFIQKLLFPFHQKEESDLNIYNKPPGELLASFKGQCRRKIVLSGRVPYEFRKIEDESELNDVFTIFQEVARKKKYNFMPFLVLLKLFRNGKKYDLCDIYAACLNDKIVNAVFIVKDAFSYYHLSSALVIRGYPEGESPSAKLHHFIMQDCFYRENKEYYNISYGGNDNFIRFKELFNPVPVEKPSYYTCVINRMMVLFFQKFTPESTHFVRSGLRMLRKFASHFPIINNKQD